MSELIRDKIYPATEHTEVNVVHDLEEAKKISYSFLDKKIVAGSVPKNAALETFVFMKNDCAALQMIYRELVLKANMNEVDSSLMQFEEKYRNFEPGNVPPEYLLAAIVELYSMRELLQGRITAATLDFVNVDLIVPQESTSALFSLCSKEIIHFCSLNKSFRKINMLLFVYNIIGSIASKYIQIEQSSDLVESAALISSQQEQIGTLDNELRTINAEYLLLKKRFAQLEGERLQQTLGRMQAQIDTLENSERLNQKEIARLQQLNQNFAVSESRMHDQVVLINSKYSELRKLYDKNVYEMKPIVEANLVSAQSNNKKIEQIKLDMVLNLEHFKVAEKRIEDYKARNAEYLEEIEALKKLLAKEREINVKFKKENERINRLCLVTSAAKGKFESECKVAERLYTKSKMQCEKLSTENTICRVEIKETEEYVIQLQGMIEDANKVHSELEKQLAIRLAQNTAQELVIANLQVTIEAQNTKELSPEQQAQWDAKEAAMKRMNERINKTLADKRHLSNKVVELETYIAALEAKLEISKGDDK